MTGAALLSRDVTDLTAPRPLAAVQGRRDPRGAPPGQEQPADDLLAAAPAVARLEDPSARRPCSRPSGGSARSPSSTRSSPARPATRCPSARSSLARRRADSSVDVAAVPSRSVRGDRRGAGPTSRRRSRWSIAELLAERRRARLRRPRWRRPRGRQPGGEGDAGPAAEEPRIELVLDDLGDHLVVEVRDNGRGCRATSTSTGNPASAWRSSALSSATSSPARSRWRPTAGRPSTCRSRCRRGRNCAAC